MDCQIRFRGYSLTLFIARGVQRGLAMALALVLSTAGVAWFERHEVM